MITIFPRNRFLKQKRDILRGVYEENLRILGKGKFSPARRKYAPYLRTTAIIIASVVLVMLQSSYLSVPFLPAGQLTATPISTTKPFGPVEDSATPSDYGSLIEGNKMPLSKVFGLGVKTIIIDAGHGGSDTGTIGKSGTKEKDIALDIAKRLKQRIEKSGHFTVLMTRDDDSTVPLNRRVDIAHASRADLFISIHLNYLPAKPINIIETYYFGPSSDEKTLLLARQENAGSKYGMGEFKDIIGKIENTIKLQESREFATSIQRNLFSNFQRENGNAYNFGVKRAPFVVLLGVDVPAVLAEVSCLSNRDEELKLNTEAHREHIAHYLEAGIYDYLKKGDSIYEARQRTGQQ